MSTSRGSTVAMYIHMLVPLLYFSRNAAAVLGILFVGRLLLRDLCDILSGFRAFFLAPLGLGRTNLLKHGSWAGTYYVCTCIDTFQHSRRRCGRIWKRWKEYFISLSHPISRV